MINANELRIGNWFYLGELIGQCNADSFKDTSILDPIPLTPDILEKAGFVEIDGIPNEYFKGLYSLRKMKERGKYNHYVLFIHAEDSFIRLSDCPTLHQLQNLYFSLTGNELNIQP